MRIKNCWWLLRAEATNSRSFLQRKDGRKIYSPTQKRKWMAERKRAQKIVYVSAENANMCVSFHLNK